MSKVRDWLQDGPLPFKVYADLSRALMRRKDKSDAIPFVVFWLSDRFGKSMRVVRYASRFHNILLFIRENEAELVRAGLVEIDGEQLRIAASLIRYLCKTPYSCSLRQVDKTPCGEVEWWRMKDILCQVAVPDKAGKKSGKRGLGHGSQ